MKIYSFFSGDTTYYTTSRNLKIAQQVGKENYKHYLDTCNYLKEKPEVGKDYFIPTELEKVSKECFTWEIKNDLNILIMCDEILDLI
jgi:hypothetical protein